jgi:multiple sugar transport system permease protein
MDRQSRAENRAAYLFLSPWIIGMVTIVAVPMVMSLYLSFTDYNLLQAPNWVGLDNYARLLEDPRYLQALGVTATYVAVSVPLQLVFALALAMILNRGLRGLAFYRGAYYLPSLIGASVAIAILWRNLFGADGLVNAGLAVFGVESRSWISDPDTALGTLILLNVWTFGAPMIIFLAGLRQIPAVYYEAAAIDGAGAVRRFFHVTFPLLTPIIFFNVILQVINAFQAFTQAFVISGGTGGPVDSTLIYSVYLYSEGFVNFRMGYASAMAWILVAIIAVLTGINFLLSRFWVHYED